MGRLGLGRAVEGGGSDRTEIIYVPGRAMVVSCGWWLRGSRMVAFSPRAPP